MTSSGFHVPIQHSLCSPALIPHMQALLTMELQKQHGLWSQTHVEQPWASTKLQFFCICELKQECSTVDESILSLMPDFPGFKARLFHLLIV